MYGVGTVSLTWFCVVGELRILGICVTFVVLGPVGTCDPRLTFVACVLDP